MIRTIEDLRGPAGRLEAVLNEGLDTSAYAALVCHPHPPSGGTMHTRAVYQTMKVFESLGIPTLRFNFRGVGVSEGTYDDGRGEVDDVRAALEWIDRTLQLPILLAGFSFGANVSWRAGCGDSRVRGLIGLGMPLEAGGRNYSYEFVSKCTQPKLLVTGAEDAFAPRERMEEVMRQAPPPIEMHWIAGAEHFFMGVPGSPAPKLPQMQEAVRTWVRSTFLGS
ncbi:alpha/beta hydrolase [Terriglobus aquaticus]|uniref:Alpha/beta hydrolase n=1 Tax=Terriglobus aquaticus TaxID=940139 RepID=A0ABW9KJA6_9BACT|nr:alpha/beta family hydrolase [Terriglobus aquaticus]